MVATQLFDAQLTTDVETLVQWLRRSDPEDVLSEATAKLQAGVPEDDLWAATAITACRYVNNQAHNLLGFVSHAMIGCEDARRLAQGQRTRTLSAAAPVDLSDRRRPARPQLCAL